MLKFLRLLYPAFAMPDEAVLTLDRARMKSAADNARARLEKEGILQVELDAQQEIRERLRAARIDRDHREGAREAA